MVGTGILSSKIEKVPRGIQVGKIHDKLEKTSLNNWSISNMRSPSPERYTTFCMMTIYSDTLRWSGVTPIFSSTGQRPVELMRYPFVRRSAVRSSGRPSVCLSVNKLFFYLFCITKYRRNLFMIFCCWSHGLVVHVQFWSSPDLLGPHRGTW